MPCFLVREKGDHFILMLDDPIFPSHQHHGQIDDETLQAMIKKYLICIEEKIRKFPAQWMMFRKFWVEEAIT